MNNNLRCYNYSNFILKIKKKYNNANSLSNLIITNSTISRDNHLEHSLYLINTKYFYLCDHQLQCI